MPSPRLGMSLRWWMFVVIIGWVCLTDLVPAGLSPLLLADTTPAAKPPRRPNIVFILADDLGYGDVGCFGQKKIRTPHLDQLAAEGMRLTQHSSGNAVCAPSRCVLMTGQHPGHAFIRTNKSVGPEGQFPIPADTVTLPKILKSLGYATGGFGKWGLGGPTSDGRPVKQGFDKFFGYNCQGVAHNYYPQHLWDNDSKVLLKNTPFSAHQKFAQGVDPKKPESYRQFTGTEYAPDLIQEQALKFIRDHKAEPFFLYVPSTIPHLALQVPEDSLVEYREKFRDDPPYEGGRGYLPHFTPRAAYAGMVTRLDRHVGQIVTLIQELGLDEQTIIVFSSDNGPLDNRFAGTDSEFFGSTANLRGYKGSLYEGGVRVPTIARWKGRIPSGTTSDRISGFEDWLPTLLELAGARDKIPTPVDGISLAPTLLGQLQLPRPFLYREFPSYGGQQSIRVGDWKAIRQKLQPASQKTPVVITTELYNLKDDPGEQTNLASQHPAILAQLEKLLQDQHTPSPEFPLPAIDKP